MMNESTVIVSFDYKHKTGMDTPDKTMKEFLEQVKDNMVDKVKEMENLAELIKKEPSPIAKYARLIEYQNQKPNYGYKVFPDSLYAQLMCDIFGYVSSGKFHKHYGDPMFSVGPLEFKLSMTEKRVSITDTVNYYTHRELHPDEKVTPYNMAMARALEEYFHGDARTGLKEVYRLFMFKEDKAQWMDLNLPEEELESYGGPTGWKRLMKWRIFRKTVRPQMEELYEKLLDKIEYEKKWHDDYEIGVERNILQKEGRIRLMKNYHLDLLMEAFQDEGFEIVYENFPETGKTL